MTKIRTHEVASVSYTLVAARKHDAGKKKYGALAHKIPGLVLQNGLAQTTGFLLAKGKQEHLAILADLTAILNAIGATTAANGIALHEEIISADWSRTMSLTRRTLEASAWIKRYVQGVLGVDATGAAAQPSESDIQASAEERS